MGALTPEYNRSKIHQHKFALWVGIGSIIMMFGALTSAYIVRRNSGNWFEFKIPDIFLLNTAVIILSSVTIHLSYKAFVRGAEKQYKGFLIATFLLGIAFLILQYKGWEALTAIGATFTANPSSSFMFVIPGLHAAHVLGGLGALTMAMLHAFILPFKPTPRRKLRFELVVQYWHFVDVLWVYLIVFFLLQS
ncbi:MAG TPA: heme-copper oxidase subunit III [Saprospiraceae bacterium]|nr:heme-copper oxidase subunit III [Saprospiraceae bacterium]HPI07352.1 heme-copper oxidase subunit III [Saprospiraceae bacterium]